MSPSEYLPAALTDLYDIEAGLEAAIRGKTHNEIAALMGISERQYYRLRSTHDLFRQAVDRARKEGLEALKDSVLTLVDNNLELSPQLVKIKADLLLWYLKVSDPAQFGDKVHITETHVDLKGALLEAKTRVINTTGSVVSSPKVDPFAD